MLYLFFADGTEEIEALTAVDLLRRAGIEIKTVGIGGKTVLGSHRIALTADCTEADVTDDFDGIILPGGMPGTLNLEQNKTVQRMMKAAAEGEKLIAAICAAPSVPGHAGLLRGRRATCYPGFEKDLEGAEVLASPVVTDGNFITSRGMGTAMDFALAIVAYFQGDAAADRLAQSVCYRRDPQ